MLDKPINRTTARTGSTNRVRETVLRGQIQAIPFLRANQHIDRLAQGDTTLSGDLPQLRAAQLDGIVVNH